MSTQSANAPLADISPLYEMTDEVLATIPLLSSAAAVTLSRTRLASQYRGLGLVHCLSKSVQSLPPVHSTSSNNVHSKNDSGDTLLGYGEKNAGFERCNGEFACDGRRERGPWA